MPSLSLKNEWSGNVLAISRLIIRSQAELLCKETGKHKLEGDFTYTPLDDKSKIYMYIQIVQCPKDVGQKQGPIGRGRKLSFGKLKRKLSASGASQAPTHCMTLFPVHTQLAPLADFFILCSPFLLHVVLTQTEACLHGKKMQQILKEIWHHFRTEIF